VLTDTSRTKKQVDILENANIGRASPGRVNEPRKAKKLATIFENANSGLFSPV
jgi:hypothetical protein